MKKVWMLITIVVVLMSLVSCSLFARSIEWESIVLCDMIPEAPSKLMKITTNDDERFYADIYRISEQEFLNYVSLCKAKGFDIDVEIEGSSFEAYNQDGYHISVIFKPFWRVMEVDLNVPIPFGEYNWDVLGTDLPKPKSDLGYLSSQYSSSFTIYIGNTTKDEYNRYVDECIESGYNQGILRGDEYFSAENINEFDITVEYEGFNTIRIHYRFPYDYDGDSKKPQTNEANRPQNTEIETSPSLDDNTQNNSGDNLTVENCSDLAKLLSLKNPEDQFVKKFAEEYKGQIIEFDGNISYMCNHGTYKTRYDILIGAGNYSESSTRGPNFQLRDVAAYSMDLDTMYVEDVLSIGTNIKIIAKVGEYSESSTLFQLDVIKVEVRD